MIALESASEPVTYYFEGMCRKFQTWRSLHYVEEQGITRKELIKVLEGCDDELKPFKIEKDVQQDSREQHAKMSH